MTHVEFWILFLDFVLDEKAVAHAHAFDMMYLTKLDVTKHEDPARAIAIAPAV